MSDINTNINLNLDYIEEAASFRVVITRMKSLPRDLTDEVSQMMWAFMFKKLEEIQLSLLTQGLNNINPGYALNQTNPVQIAKQLLNKALEE